MDFYERIDKISKEKGMTISYLLNQCGISNGSQSNWKNGAIPRPSTLKAIADYLGVHPSFLLGLEDEQEETQKEAQNNAIDGIGDIEREIILLCKSFSMQQKNALLTRAYEIRDGK